MHRQPEFSRNDMPHMQAMKLNSLASRVYFDKDRIDTVEAKVALLDGQAPGSDPLPTGDPGDLTLWYENGKA